MILKPNNIASTLMFISVFCGAISIPIGGLSTNPAPIFAIIAIALFSVKNGFKIQKSILFFAVLVAIHGMISVAAGNTSFLLFSKTFLAAFFIYWGFSAAINSKPNPEFLIKSYLTVATIVAFIGMIQAVGWISQIKPLYSYSWISGWKFAPGGLLGMRIQSVLYEPSQVGFTMGPAACLSVIRLSGRIRHILGLWAALQIVLITILSGSDAAIFVLAVFLGLLMLRGGIFMSRLLIVVLITIPVLISMGFFQTTIIKYIGLLQAFGFSSGFDSINSTTFTLYFHFGLAIENFIHSFGMGGGIGSHEVLSSSVLSSGSFEHNVWNLNSAGNITFRMLSEFGIFGIIALILFAIFVAKGLYRLSGNAVYYHAAFSAGICGFMIRNGTYAHYGIAFFLLILISINRAYSTPENTRPITKQLA